VQEIGRATTARAAIARGALHPVLGAAVRKSYGPLEGFTASPNGLHSNKDSGGIFYMIRLA
jgi:hypothetical protein